MRTKKVCAVVGAQFGSEGKGVVVKHIANQYGAHVRTGGPNAGHTFEHGGQVFKLQQLPVGFTNPNAKLYIGPGATMDLNVLEREIKMVENLGHNVRQRIVIDERAGVITGKQHADEGGVNGAMHRTIGSTGEGVGACRLDRVARGFSEREFKQAKDCGVEHLGRLSEDISYDLNGHSSILLEGTQGFGLSLVHGSWPKVTSHDTTVGTLCADAGVPVTHVDRVVLVVRTFPIRVAGPSGDLPGELSWDKVSEIAGREVQERTTVTNKIRRVGTFDTELVMRAARVNGATEVALTFADYMDPANYLVQEWDKLTVSTRGFIDSLEANLNLPVTMIGTGFTQETGWTVVESR